jgi:hypothetical protein
MWCKGRVISVARGINWSTKEVRQTKKKKQRDGPKLDKNGVRHSGYTLHGFIVVHDQIDYPSFLRRGVEARSSRTAPLMTEACCELFFPADCIG